MRAKRLVVWLVLGFGACFSLNPVAAEEPAAPRTERPTEGPPCTGTDEADKADVERLLEVISVGPYEVPPLVLKKDHNYAYSAMDVEPFRHVTPYREHFLEQMEYTGPGRAIPEPEDIETVKIGFIGPIMGTVSVATGGKSHEESLGIPMLRGAQLAVEQANQRGG